MKLLLDENLSRRLVPFLQEDYPGSTQVALIDMEQSNDRQLWEYARTEGFVLVSKDSDYRDLSTLLGTPPQVILLTVGNSSKTVILKILCDRKADIHAFLANQTIGCVEIDH